jgi:hypothetical protein
MVAVQDAVIRLPFGGQRLERNNNQELAIGSNNGIADLSKVGNSIFLFPLSFLSRHLNAFHLNPNSIN